MVDTHHDIGSFDDGRDGIASCQPQGLDGLLRDGRDHVGTAGELYGHFAIYRAILNFCDLSVKNIASSQLTRSKVFRDHDQTSLEDRTRRFSSFRPSESALQMVMIATTFSPPLSVRSISALTAPS